MRLYVTLFVATHRRKVNSILCYLSQHSDARSKARYGVGAGDVGVGSGRRLCLWGGRHEDGEGGKGEYIRDGKGEGMWLVSDG